MAMILWNWFDLSCRCRIFRWTGCFLKIRPSWSTNLNFCYVEYICDYIGIGRWMNVLEQTDAKVNCSCEICTSRRLCKNVAQHFMDIAKPLTFESTWPSLAKQGWHICKSSAVPGSASKVARTKYFWVIGAMTYTLFPVNLTFNYGTSPVCKISHISKTWTLPFLNMKGK